MKSKKKNATNRALEIIRSGNGTIKTSQAIKAGIHPRTLYSLLANGEIEQLSRGLYRLTELEPLDNIDIVTVALRCPSAVICLASALSFHNITTQIPHNVSIAVKKETEYPKIDYPPVTIHKFSDSSYKSGINTYDMEGVTVKIYDAEKTIADCFKFRSQIGMETVIEALRLYKNRHKFDAKKLLEYARICRVYKVMIPYLESLI